MLKHKHLYSIKSPLKFFVFNKTVTILIFYSVSFTFFNIVPVLAFSFMNSFRKIMTKFDNELAINLALSINCSMYGIFHVIFSPLLPVLVTSFSIGTVKVIYFSLLFPKEVKKFSNSSTKSFMIK